LISPDRPGFQQHHVLALRRWPCPAVHGLAHRSSRGVTPPASGPFVGWPASGCRDPRVSARD
jgi:hypothetical protein